MTGHGLWKLGDRKDGFGRNRYRKWEQIQIYKVLIHGVRICNSNTF